MNQQYWKDLDAFIQHIFQSSYYGSYVVVEKADAMKALNIKRLTADRVHEIKVAARDKNVYCVYDDAEHEFIFCGKAHVRRLATRLIWK